MLSSEEFVEHLIDAYEHLYDLVYLRSHAFTEILLEPVSDLRKERAWALHYLLLNAIQELNPGAQAPTVSREWRRYRLMTLRYVDGLSPQEVADRLAISRRHYYRSHDEALHALASIFWQRYSVHEGTPISTPAAPSVPADRLELLRLEAAKLSRMEGHTSVNRVLDGVLALLKEKLDERSIEVAATVPEDVVVSVDRTLLRQLLFGVLGYLIENLSGARIQINAQLDPDRVLLSLESSRPIALNGDGAQERIAAFEELASLSETQVVYLPEADTVSLNEALPEENSVPFTGAIPSGETVYGFRLVLPAHKRQQTIMVIDDNPDVLELFQRYLALHNYEVSLAQNAQQALATLKQIKPFAIILDLMMPELDGWDLLQLFLNQPETQSIPLIVCSVLKQKELALSMGATYFLEKPISEQKLISVLALL